MEVRSACKSYCEDVVWMGEDAPVGEVNQGIGELEMTSFVVINPPPVKSFSEVLVDEVVPKL